MYFSKLFFIAFVSIGSTSISNAEPLTLYGKANLSVQSAEEGDGRFTEIKSNSSRVGILGDLLLDDGLTVFYKLEWQVDLADNSGSDNIKSRNQYIGLKGDFGKIFLGRNDTILKQLSGKIDQFSDYEADLKHLWKGKNRVSNSVTYESPKFNNFTFGVSYIAEDGTDSKDGISSGVYYGDKNLKKSSWFASYSIDSEVNGYDVQRAAVHTKMGKMLLGAILQKQEAIGSNNSESGVLLNAQYPIDKWKMKVQYQSLKDDNSASIGADYKLSSLTKAYIWFTKQRQKLSEDKSWLGLGLEHKFQ